MTKPAIRAISLISKGYHGLLYEKDKACEDAGVA
jgi:hypothetical protein